jgi:hypothetical protein
MRTLPEGSSVAECSERALAMLPPGLHALALLAGLYIHAVATLALPLALPLL